MYCTECKGFGYIKEGADTGWIYCVSCNGKQVRPIEDYEPARRAAIMSEPKFRRTPIKPT